MLTYLLYLVVPYGLLQGALQWYCSKIIEHNHKESDAFVSEVHILCATCFFTSNVIETIHYISNSTPFKEEKTKKTKKTKKKEEEEEEEDELLKKKVKKPSNIIGIPGIVTFVAGISELFAYYNSKQNHPLILVDYYETHSIISQWPEWLLTVPCLVYLSCSLQDNVSSSSSSSSTISSKDRLLITLSGCTILFGALSHIFNSNLFVSNTSSILYQYRMMYLPLSWCCYGMATYLALNLYENYEVYDDDKFKTHPEIVSLETTLSEIEIFDRKMYKFHRANRLSMMKILFLGIFNYFPLITILDYCQVLSINAVIIANSIGSLISKLTFCTLLIKKYTLADDYYEKELEILKKTKAREAELRTMIANVAHDLKTPLSGILSGIQLIDLIFGEVKENIEKINNKSENPFLGYIKRNILQVLKHSKHLHSIHTLMLMTINRYLDATKSSKGIKLMAKKETLDLKETLEVPITCMKSLLPEEITLLPVVISPDISKYIISDKQWIIENVLCLLSNAVKYSEKGDIGVKLSLIKEPHTERMKERSSSNSSISSISSGDTTTTTTTTNSLSPFSTFLKIEIKDHGIGIENEQMKDLFNPFKQVQRMAGGTGLGLYSLSKRIDSLGGKYGVHKHVQDEHVTGSVFWFTIPYVPDVDCIRKTDSTDTFTTEVNPKQAEEKEEEAVSAAEQTKETKGHILFVDDSITVSKMSKKILEKANYKVSVVNNGAKAVDAIEKCTNEKTYDIILMDFQMPVMDGLEATRRIRQFEQQQRRPIPGITNKFRYLIIGNSANSDSEVNQEAKRIGMDYIMEKPFDLNRFESIVNQSKNNE